MISYFATYVYVDLKATLLIFFSPSFSDKCFWKFIFWGYQYSDVPTRMKGGSCDRTGVCVCADFFI